MRTMLKAQIPVEAGSRAIKENRIGRVIEKLMADLKPESVYFTATEGKRTMFAFFDLAEPSDLPRLLEPLFVELEVSVELSPVMNADDLKAGLGKLRTG